MEIEKVSDYEYRLKKHGTMNSDANIFASPTILNDLKKDKTLEQLKNMASLPGLVGNACILPDAHQGYGFSIGGVAALSKKEGGISPGGVGFDINCLHPSTKVLSDLGYNMEIKDFCTNNIIINNNSFLANKLSMEFNAVAFNDKLISSKINYAMKKSSDDGIYVIKTMFGRALKCSGDHPIFTVNGKINSEKLKVGDKALINPFIGVEYEKPGNKELVAESNFKGQMHAFLKERQLLPLTESNPKIGYIARIMGYLFGDGTIYYSGNKGYVSFYGEEGDLTKIKNDLEIVGYKSNIYKRTRNHSIKTKYDLVNFSATNYELHCNSKSFANLIKLLGAPVGNKTRQSFSIPSWIMESKKWVKRLFLSGFFSAELSKPKIMNGYNFYTPILCQNRIEKHIPSCYKMFEQITDILMDFGVRINKISLGPEHEYINSFGEKTYRLRLIIAGDSKTLINLYSKIGFDYNEKRQKLGFAAINYLLFKESIINYRSDLEKQAKILKNKALPLKDIIKILNSDCINERFVERSIWGGRKSSPRIPKNFLSFDEFSRITHFNNGVLADEIISIEKKDYKGFLYDINIEDDCHNFTANSFIVSNCGVRVLKTNLLAKDFKPKIKELLNELYLAVPSGLGSEGLKKFEKDEFFEMLNQGLGYLQKKGLAKKTDLLNCEDNGFMKDAGHEFISQRALARGKNTVGSLGSGNHFMDLLEISEVFDEKAAKMNGLFKGQAVIMIHSGSRGLGHQVASDYINEIMKKYPELVKSLPDPEICYAPAGSDLADKYYKSMAACANYAYANRQLMMNSIKEKLCKSFKSTEESLGLELFYDITHNVARLEKYNGIECYVHRKGATRCIKGGKIIIPGSMGTSSYLMIGENAQKSINSSAHGSGRIMSRSSAIKNLNKGKILDSLSSKGIMVKSSSKNIINEEAPQAYKDINDVIGTTEQLGFARKLAQMNPFAVING